MTIDRDTLIILDLIGYLGYTLLAVGMFLIAKDDHRGWTLRALGEILWIGVSANIGLTSGVIFGVLFLVIDLYAVLILAPSESD